MKYKIGVSLIVLVITIVVILILTTITIISFGNSVTSTNLAAFVNDLKEVEDSFEATVINSGVSGISSTYTKAQVLTLVGENSTEFEKELTLNGDASEEDFYVVNLKDIGILKSARGNKKNGDADNDVYVVAKKSMRAYYLKGIKEKDVFYFSISSKI